MNLTSQPLEGPEHLLARVTTEIPEQNQKRSEALGSPDDPVYPLSLWYSGYSPRYLTHVSQVFKDGTVNLAVRVYLPIGAAPENLAVEVKVGQAPWQSLQPPQMDQPCWSLDLSRIRVGSEIAFRYRDSAGSWKSIAPLNDLDNVYQTLYVPKVDYLWNHQPPRYDHAKALMETTLEGLLAGYKGGKFSPQDIDELFQGSIAQRILKTDIPGQLSQWNIDEIMVPVCASVANRAHLDPKFNYLTYNFVETDWQIGSTYEFKALVDRFYKYGIQVVPDLIFAHQVRDPFRGQGSMDQISYSDHRPVFVDLEAFLFRDYGTWMLNLEVPEIRKMLAEKIVTFIKTYRLKIIRIDYIDGLILQYSNRLENHAEQFIQELKAELEHHCPDVVALGETFEVAGNPAVRRFIDVFYAPIGFSIVEELYQPPQQMERPLYPSVEVLADHINQVLRSDRREAYYAQLHDETWYCPHIVQGRPYVPWAYGGNPAQLAKNQGDQLVEMGLLDSQHLLDFVRRTVRNAEALTMFLASLRYMFVPSVDSLSLGCLDDPQQWKVSWEGIAPNHLKQWQKTGLSNSQILALHHQHRTDMVKLRGLFRHHTKVDETTYQPQVKIQVNHCDRDAALLSLFRFNPHHPEDCLLVVFNFGPQTFRADLCYELPVPEGFVQDWQVLFDGDWMETRDAGARDAGINQNGGYPADSILSVAPGQYSNRPNVLSLKMGCRSLIILRLHQT